MRLRVRPRFKARFYHLYSCGVQPRFKTSWRFASQVALLELGEGHTVIRAEQQHLQEEFGPRTWRLLNTGLTL